MSLTLLNPLDMHLHLRDGEMLANIAKESAHTFCGALIMPNLVPPVSTKEEVIAYKQRIIAAIGDETFTPYMTLFFKPSYDKAFLTSIKDEITAIKLYPAGITTNSEGGVSGFDVEELRPALEAMSELGIPLCVHGETNGFVMDREAEFVNIYEKLAHAFPKLVIIMEHITTKESVAALDRFENLYATITVHHLLITLDDVAGGMLRPHLFCKPIAKRPEDKDALLDAVLSGHPKVMFGSDSAPHPKHAKESCGCAAGVFTAPLALQILAELFDKENAALEHLQAFISGNAQRIYKLNPPAKTVRLKKQSFHVPSDYKGVVPMYAGEEIAYTIEEVNS
ncbi:MAG TPA: dihydroorotase [Sulfurovum sp.]|jgi:dihydroorotase|nr:dihydroorotase [Sulfurovum sp.]HQS72277.1 dihydroorotase [Sulfurovum sp.]HQS77008.1 dihydroorotase [Sulfurovum sp.]HQT28482.1 dihydroorotase [Sulfurovum sp.]